MWAYGDLLVDHNGKADDRELNGGHRYKSHESAGSERLRRAGVPEAFLFGLLMALKPYILTYSLWKPRDLSSGKVTVLSDQGLLTASFSSDFLLKGSLLDISLEAKALTYASIHSRMCYLRTYTDFLRCPPQHCSLVAPPRALCWPLSSRRCGSPRHPCIHPWTPVIDFPQSTQQTQHYSRVLALAKSQLRMTQGAPRPSPVPGLTQSAHLPQVLLHLLHLSPRQEGPVHFLVQAHLTWS